MSEEKDMLKVIKEFNDALREAVIEEYKKLRKCKYVNNDTIQIKMLDICNAKDEELKYNEQGKSVAEKIGEPELKNENDNDDIGVYNDTFINYYWIEYDFEKEDDKRKERITFFYKDIDANTCNVHVIPGIIQKWEYMTKIEKEKLELPWINTKGNVIIKKNPNPISTLVYDKNSLKMEKVDVNTGSIPFIEKNEKGYWVPRFDIKVDGVWNLELVNEMNASELAKIMNVRIYCQVDARRRLKLPTIEKYDEIINSLTKVEYTKETAIHNKCKNKIEKSKKSGGSPETIYRHIKWLNATIHEAHHAINLFDLAYFEDVYGLFTIYNYLSIGLVLPKKGTEWNEVNRRKDEDNTLFLTYRVIDKPDSNKPDSNKPDFNKPNLLISNQNEECTGFMKEFEKYRKVCLRLQKDKEFKTFCKMYENEPYTMSEDELKQYEELLKLIRQE